MGKGKKPGEDDGGSGHMSRPLATLKDPSSFGPPPRNVNYHGGAALPNEITPHTGGLGAPLTQSQISSARAPTQSAAAEEAEEQPPAGPPLPYRADRTGLRTDHLPPPPVHRDLTSAIPESTQSHTATVPKPKPGLPPRLPARQNSAISQPATTSSPPPPAYELPATESHAVTPQINSSAVNRLQTAGVSVPALGIGDSGSWKPKSPTPTTSSPAPQTSQLSELQQRFARMTQSNPGPQSSLPAQTSVQQPIPALAQATAAPVSQQVEPQTQPQIQPQPLSVQPQTQQQTPLQSAQTLSNLHQNPSAVSPQDAALAAKNLNDFRAKHQDTLNTGARKASDFNKRYNVTGRLNSFLDKHVSPTGSPTVEQGQPVGLQQPVPTAAGIASQQPAQLGGQGGDMSASIARKPPPPPPNKKPANMHAPPPVPLGTRPSLGQ